MFLPHIRDNIIGRSLVFYSVFSTFPASSSLRSHHSNKIFVQNQINSKNDSNMSLIFMFSLISQI